MTKSKGNPENRKVQRKLLAMGYNVGPVDGVSGPLTRRAVRAFLRVTGRRACDWSGPVNDANGRVYKILRDWIEQAIPTPDHAPWAHLAFNQLGEREWAGEAENNPKIVQWFEKIDAPWFTTDETPWCAAFVGAMLVDAGLDSSGSARARSYENWGESCEPLSGSIAVLKRGNNPKQGHVGFVVAVDEGEDMICILGGNQGDAVSFDWFPMSRVVTCRWPTGCARPENAVSMSATGDEPTTD